MPSKAAEKVKSEAESRVLWDDERVTFLLGLQLRFVLLLVFCSFLCLEQWSTFIFRIELLLNGCVCISCLVTSACLPMLLFRYAINWAHFLRPSVFQVHLVAYLLITSLVVRSGPRGRFHPVPALLKAGLVCTAFVGCLLCLGGYFRVVESLETCLVVTVATGLLLAVWVALAVPTTPRSPAFMDFLPTQKERK